MAVTVKELLSKYSKAVIIEWISSNYPIFMRKDLKKELDEVKKDIEFNSVSKELDLLFDKLKELKEKPFSVTIAIEQEQIRNRIRFLVNKQSKMVEED